MLSRVCLVFVAGLALAAAAGAAGEGNPNLKDPDQYDASDCDTKEQTSATFANIEALQAGQVSYKISGEIVNSKAKESTFFEEWYDGLNKRGKIEFYRAAGRQTYYYYDESKEGFLIESNQCKSFLPGDYKSDLFGLPTDDWSFEGELKMLGPSRIWANAFRYSKQNGMNYVGQGDDQIQNKDVDVWRRCVNNNQMLINYYIKRNTTIKNAETLRVEFIDLKAASGVAEDFSAAFITMDTANLETSFLNVDELFLIPASCDRTYDDSLGVAIDLTDKDISLDMEITSTTFAESGRPPITIVNSAELVMDGTNDIMALRHKSWTVTEKDLEKNPGNVVLGPLKIELYDRRNNIHYTRNLDEGTCSHQVYDTTDHEDGPILTLSDGVQIMFEKSEDIWSSSKDFVHMGVSTQRALKTNVYQRKFDEFDFGKFGKFPTRITRYYLIDDVIFGSSKVPKNALVKVELRIFYKEKSPPKIVTLNINNLMTGVDNNIHQSLVDVSECYARESDSQWLQIAFPLGKGDAEALEMADIRGAFLKTLYNEQSVGILRVPQVIIDQDPNMLYISAQVLQVDLGILLSDNFDMTKGQRYLGTNELIFGSNGETCVGTCADNEACVGFSVCGVVCSFSFSDSTGTSAQEGCELFDRKKKDDVLEKTMNGIIADIQRAVDANQFKVEVNGLLLKGTDMVAGFTFGTTQSVRFMDKRSRNYQGVGSYQVAWIGGKFNEKQETSLQTFLGISMSDCRLACEDDFDCHSFSICQEGPRCVLSPAHRDQITSDMVSTDSKCYIFSKQYLAEFNAVSVAVIGDTVKAVRTTKGTADECAKECLNAKDFDCMSFDHCAPETCLLHKVHMLDKDSDEAKVSDWKQNDQCKHYSKNFLYNFRPIHKQRLAKGRTKQLSHLTPEECARQCLFTNECETFEYCQGDQKNLPTKQDCFLSYGTPQENGLTPDPLCTVFQYNPNARLRVTVGADGPTRYSSGLGVGMAFLFLFIGIASGIGAYYGYLYYSSR